MDIGKCYAPFLLTEDNCISIFLIFFDQLANLQLKGPWQNKLRAGLRHCEIEGNKRDFLLLTQDSEAPSIEIKFNCKKF